MPDWFNSLTQTPAAPPPERGSDDWWAGISAPAGPTIGPTDNPLPANVIEDPARMASMSKQAVASLPTDDMARVRYLAAQRFPNEPVEKAMERYFWKDDRLAYRDPDGKAYYEEPKFRAPTSAANLRQDAKMLATGAGPSLPMIGGAVGGIAAMAEGPPGWAAGVPQAAAGGAVGDAGRQILARALTGEEKSTGERLFQNVGAAGEQAGAQALGNFAIGALNRFGQAPAYNIPATTAVRDAASRLRIRLTPGEETGNRTLLRRQKILANTTEGEEQFTDFYQGRNEDVSRAVTEMLERLSPGTSPHMGAHEGVQGANAALATNREGLRAQAGPLYRQHVDENPQRFWTPEVEELFSRPSMQRALTAAQALAAEEGRTITVPTFENGRRVANDVVPDWRSWDYIKKALDGDVEGHTNEFGRVSQMGRAVANTRRDLLSILDPANPGYAEARGVFSDNVPVRTALEEGQVGSIAKLAGDDVNKAGGIIFGKNSSPEDVRFARQAFENANQMDAWNSLVRSHLEQTFRSIPDSATGTITNLGGTWRKAIMGSQTKRDIMDAALEHNPGYWRDFNDLMSVLDATGRAMKGESITAFAQAGQRELARESRGVVPALIETVEFWKAPGRVAQYWNELRASQYAQRQAELLTTPEGRQVLRELRQLGTGSRGSVMLLSRFLTGGAEATVGMLAPEKNGNAVSPKDIRAGLAR